MVIHIYFFLQKLILLIYLSLSIKKYNQVIFYQEWLYDSADTLKNNAKTVTKYEI